MPTEIGYSKRTGAQMKVVALGALGMVKYASQQDDPRDCPPP